MTIGNRRKAILNTAERASHAAITGAAAPHGAEVLVKMRVADVLDIANSGISNEVYSYALKAHFDFVVATNNFAEFCVEFDGPGHDPGNDHLKNHIAEHFGLPLFRFGLPHLNSSPIDVNFIAWMVHNWFGLKEFRRLQDTGKLSETEPYDLEWFSEFPDAKKPFPFDFASRFRSKISKIMQEHYWFEDSAYEYGLAHMKLNPRFFSNLRSGTCACIARIRVCENVYVTGQSTIRLDAYALPKRQEAVRTLRSFVEGMALSDLHANLIETVAGGGVHRVTKGDICRLYRHQLAAGMIEGVILYQ